MLEDKGFASEEVDFEDHLVRDGVNISDVYVELATFESLREGLSVPYQGILIIIQHRYAPSHLLLSSRLILTPFMQHTGLIFHHILISVFHQHHIVELIICRLHIRLAIFVDEGSFLAMFFLFLRKVEPAFLNLNIMLKPKLITQEPIYESVVSVFKLLIHDGHHSYIVIIYKVDLLEV